MNCVTSLLISSLKIFLKIRHQLDALQTDASSNFQHFDNVNMDCELIEFPPTSIEELSRLVKKISTKSCSLDPVPATLISYCIDDLLPIIQTVVNSSFESAVVPTSMKKAVLSPLLKKQDLDFETFSNFRPISNLKFLSKVIEKVAAERLWEYVRVNGLDETLRSAYRKQHSCETALLRVQNDILMALDSRKCVILLLLDLSAAFDTVDHEILLRRLHSKFGIK